MTGKLRSLRDSCRGQAHTLEAIAAATIILTSIVFAVQATAITPLTISTSHQHIETQQKKMADGVLASGTYSENPNELSPLEETLLYWNTDKQRFYNATPGGYLGEYPDTEFGHIMNDTFYDRSIATNVYVTYSRAGNGSATMKMVTMGEPSNNAMSATTTVVLYDYQQLTAPSETQSIGDTPAFYAPDAFPDSEVYNVIEVRIVVWRI